MRKSSVFIALVATAFVSHVATKAQNGGSIAQPGTVAAAQQPSREPQIAVRPPQSQGSVERTLDFEIMHIRGTTDAVGVVSDDFKLNARREGAQCELAVLRKHLKESAEAVKGGMWPFTSEIGTAVSTDLKERIWRVWLAKQAVELEFMFYKRRWDEFEKSKPALLREHKLDAPTIVGEPT